MFFHQHPYQPFIPENTTKLIVGTLPPPRFSTGGLLEQDVNFCYGSYYNSLWLFIDKIYKLKLRFDNSEEAIIQRKNFLIEQHIGVCDIVESCERDKIDASDLGMKNIILRDVISYIKHHKKINTLLFMGGNSKNGPEYFFRKHIRDYNLKLTQISEEVPRKHEFLLEEINGEKRKITTISLTSPSGSANRAIGSHPKYKKMKSLNPKYTTFDFRIDQYSNYL